MRIIALSLNLYILYNYEICFVQKNYFNLPLLCDNFVLYTCNVFLIGYLYTRMLMFTGFFFKGSIMFHVRRRPADSQPRRRKKKPLGVSNGSNNVMMDREGPTLVEITHNGDGGRRVKLGVEPIEVSDISLCVVRANKLFC